MTTNKVPIRSLFDSQDFAALSRTSIFNTPPGNTAVVYLKKTAEIGNNGGGIPAKKFSLFNSLTDLTNKIKERKELRGRIKQFLGDLGIEITKEIRSALPDTFSRGNSITLRNAVKENVTGHTFIQMQFLSLMTLHINEGDLPKLLENSNIFSKDKSLISEINSKIQEEMSDIAKRSAPDILESVKQAKTKFLRDNTNLEYGKERILWKNAEEIASEAGKEGLLKKFSEIKPSREFIKLAQALAICIDKIIENNDSIKNSVKKSQIAQLKGKIIESLFISTFKESLIEEIKKNANYSANIRFDFIDHAIKDLTNGAISSSSENESQAVGETEMTSNSNFNSKKLTRGFSGPIPGFKSIKNLKELQIELQGVNYQKYWPVRNDPNSHVRRLFGL
jgi:hypothetical protein